MDPGRKAFWGGFSLGVASGLLVSFLAVALFVGWQVRALRARMAARQESMSAPLEGKGAFDFELKDVNPKSATFGRTVKLSDLYSGHGIVLNFMASWCGPCRQELPDLQEILAAGTARVACVAASEEGGSDDLVSIANRQGLTMPILYAPPDLSDVLDQHYTHEIIPTTYLIDATGTIKKVLMGARPKSALERFITENLGKS